MFLKKTEMLPKGAVLVNVGRGSLIPSGTSAPTQSHQISQLES